MGFTAKKEIISAMKGYNVLLVILCISCQVSNTTPEKYKYKTTVSSVLYSNHKNILTDSIRLYIDEKRKAYYPKENDSLTEIVIDTIVYSPNRDRAAFFVITKNSNDKLLSKGSKDEFHYDAHCFIALFDSINFKNVNWLSAHNLTNYTTHQKTSERIREIYFKNFKGSQGIFKYNLDDVRFWKDINVWGNVLKYQEIFEDDK